MATSEIEILKLKVKSQTNEIKTMKKNINDLEDALGDARDEIKETGEVSDKTSSKLSTFAQGAVMAIGAVAGAALASGIGSMISDFASETMEWSNSFNELQRQTGATDTQMRLMKASATDLYKKGLGEGLSDITDVMGVVRTTTGLFGDDLTAATQNAIILRDTFEKDVASSVRTVDTAMNVFGADQQAVFDNIAYVIQQTGDPADDLLDTVNEYSSTFEEAGYSVDGMFASFLKMNDAGLYDFDKGADAIREFGIKTREGSDDVQQAYNKLFQTAGDWEVIGTDGQALVIDSWWDLDKAITDGSVNMAMAGDFMQDALGEIEDPLLRNQIAASLVGTQYEDLGEDILAAFDTDNMSAIDNAGGTMDALNESMQTGLVAAWERFTRTIKASIFEALEPFAAMLLMQMVPVVENLGVLFTKKVVPSIQKFSKIISKELLKIIPKLTKFVVPLVKTFSEWIKKNGELITKVGRFIGIVVGVITVVSGIIAVFSSVIGVVGATAGAFALLLNPIVWVAVAIGLLYTAYQENFLGIGDLVDSVVSWVVDKLQYMAGWFTTYGLPFIAEAIGWFSDVWDDFKIGLAAIWEYVKPHLQSIYDWFVTTGLPLMSDAVDLYLTGIGKWRDILIGLWSVVKPYLEKAYDWFVSDGIPAMGDAVDDFKTGVETVKNKLMAFWALVKPFLEQAYNWFVTEGIPAMGDAWDGFKDKINTLKNILMALWALVSPYLSSMQTWFVTDGIPLMGEAWDGFKDKITTLKNILMGLWALVKPYLEQAYNWFVTDGIPAMTTAAEGVTTAITGIKNIATTLWTDISSSLSALQGGMQSVFGSIQSVVSSVSKAFNDVKNAINSMPSPPSWMSDAAGGVASFIFGDGRMSGGWTGSAPVDRVTGFHHGQEWVVPHTGTDMSVRVYPTPQGLQASGAFQVPMAMGGGGGSGWANITVLLDGDVIYDKVTEINRNRAY